MPKLMELLEPVIKEELRISVYFGNIYINTLSYSQAEKLLTEANHLPYGKKWHCDIINEWEGDEFCLVVTVSRKLDEYQEQKFKDKLRTLIRQIEKVGNNHD